MAVSQDLVEIALSRVSGTEFENFCNAFFPALLGVEYSPLGGMHDGGADGFGGDVVHTRQGRAGQFFQASVQKDVKNKIRSTVRRLREVNRAPRQLTFFTSHTVSKIDILEDELSDELSLVVRIKDGSYIAAHINDNDTTGAAFDRYLRNLTDFLVGVGNSQMITNSQHVRSPAVFVFLRQEIDKLDGDLGLVNSMTDSLAVWALEGTDPDAGVFMSSAEVLSRICEHIPSAKNLIEPRIRQRLEKLSKRDYPGGRQVNWHRQEDMFVLPLATRQRIEDENRDDEALRLRVLRSLHERAEDLRDPELDSDSADKVAAVTLRAFQYAFEQEGLEFSHFVSSENSSSYPQLSDAVRSALETYSISGAGSSEIARASFAVARDCLYRGTPDEREYLGRLARTYSLLFTLNNEPRLVTFIERMTSDFYLYVGSDMIIRALSERYLPASGQMCRNMLQMAHRGGATLILTEPVLEEVLGNIRASDKEFRNYVQGVEDRMTVEMKREVPKILVRAYLYNKTEEGGPFNWPAFVEQFLSYANLFKPAATPELRQYLQASFGMRFKTREDLESLCDMAEVDRVTDTLAGDKDNVELAANDSLLAHAVYGHRRRNSEVANVSEFGFRTWWLTNETRILQRTRRLEAANNGARYMLRPDFLLNYFAFAPKATEIRRTFGDVFPSLLGMQLSKRMDEDAFHKIMNEVKEAEDLEEGRRLAVMANCVDRLKGDFDRRYFAEI